MPFGSKVVTNSKPYLEGLSWDTGTTKTLTYDMPLHPPVADAYGNRLLTSTIANTSYTRLVNLAFDLWSAVTGITFKNTTGSTIPPNIRVGFGDLPWGTFGYTPPPAVITGKSFLAPISVVVQNFNHLTMATATATLSATKLPDGDLRLSYLTGTSTTTLFQTLVHEIGHALGLAHNRTDPYSVMFSAADNDVAGASPANLSIDRNDVAAIDSLYGLPAAPIQPLILSYLPTARFIDMTTDSATIPGVIPAGLGGINPFAGLNVTDLTGLGYEVRVVLYGAGTLNDPTAGNPGTFTNGVFVETGIDINPTPHVGEYDEAGYVLRRITFTPSQTQAETAVFQVRVTDSLGQTATKTISLSSAPAVAARNATVAQNATTSVDPTPTGSTNNEVRITLGTLTASITPSMQFLQSSSPLQQDVQTFTRATSSGELGSALQKIVADVKTSDLIIQWQNPVTAAQASQGFTVSDHGASLVSITLTGAVNDPTIGSELAALKLISI